MTETDSTDTRIAARLEAVFAARGFTEPGVDALRDASEVSLRTLYKYFPSREAMILGALESRHKRYMCVLFDDLPGGRRAAMEALFERMAVWMETNAPRGCLFHGAISAHPDSADLNAMFRRHKHEVARAMARATDLEGHVDTLLILHEGVTQAWPLIGRQAARQALSLASALIAIPAIDADTPDAP